MAAGGDILLHRSPNLIIDFGGIEAAWQLLTSDFLSRLLVPAVVRVGSSQTRVCRHRAVVAALRSHDTRRASHPEPYGGRSSSLEQFCNSPVLINGFK